MTFPESVRTTLPSFVRSVGCPSFARCDAVIGCAKESTSTGIAHFSPSRRDSLLPSTMITFRALA